MAVGELFLSAFLQVLFDRLASRELLEFLRQDELHSKLKKWEETLKMVQAVLGDAEEKQLTDRAVKMWLDDLRDLAYDVEDVLDELVTEALSRKLKMQQRDQASTSTSKVRKLIPARLSNLSLSAVKFSAHMRSQIKDISSRLEGIYEKRLGLGLQMNVGGVSTLGQQRRPPTSSVQPEPAVYGRDQDKAEVLEMVLRDRPDPDANFRVISIVAMGGVGKTTLAREVYNDKAMEDFNPRVWVCVSDEFDVLGISKAILKSITCSPCNLDNLNEVQIQLKNQVAGKKFLLVLDDVWNTDYGLWEILKSPFLGGAKGSKMIVTTRLEDVALTVGREIDFYKLKLLSDDDCWSVFKKHAFESEVVGAHSEPTRAKVVDKCRGLPLAARTLGGLLRCKPRSDWEHILNSQIWNLYDENGVLPVLRLSYHHLPSHLKRCFAFCAILPKDYEFEENEIVLLWMAEGLIQPSEDDRQPEDLGSEYFRDLLSRSVFQRSIGNDTKFGMHDLVNDLAQLVSGVASFRLESSLKLNMQSKRLERSRHSSYICGNADGKDKFEVFHKVELIRTFLPIFIEHMLKRYDRNVIYITSYVVFNLLPKLKKLRVLSLRKYYITELPNSIGALRHLRYLNLSSTMITSLPQSTSLLINLQTLLLRDCIRIKKLPSDMKNLINLRHLDITGVSLEEMPVGMKDLKNLRTLSNFIVGKRSGCDLKDLKYLKFLSGELHISRLENATNLQDTREAMLGDKNGLKVLHFEWGSQFDDSRNEEAEECVLGKLRPHKNLTKLSVKFYGGRRFPSWVGDPSFSNMVVLRLENCQNCNFLPSLGFLSSLKDLTIKGMWSLKDIGSEIYGGDCSFQSLEILCFDDLQEWECWNPMEENEQHVARFPSLRKLSIVKCSKLSGRLPNHLPSLEKLVVRECQRLAVSFSSLPMLCELEIDGCKGMTCSSVIDYESLKSMALSHFSDFGNWLRQGFQKVEHLKIEGCEELICLWQKEICVEQPPKGFHSFTSLRELCIEGCKALTSLPEGIKHNIAHLQCLEIKDCHSITFIVIDHLPSSLKQLKIENCKNLQCLVDGKEDTCTSLSSSSAIHMENINKSSISLLEKLSISRCSSLTCIFSKGQFPASLKHLKLKDCLELTILSSRGWLPEALEELVIEECPKLESIAERFFNNTYLKHITIWSCENLKSIPMGLHNLIHLSHISIDDCPSLASFPEEGFSNVNSLQTLFIGRCPSITFFPQECFSTNLTWLSIEGLNIYKPLVEWGLHNLTSLTYLSISGCPEAESFPQEEIGMMLPPSLKKLMIRSFPKLKYLFPNGFQNLTSLETLCISDCRNLASFPEVGLPSSLLQLNIYNCPLLKKQCKRDKGREWSKIANIPRVEIDNKFIYDPEE